MKGEKIVIKVVNMWGDEEFAIDEWGNINYFVGPNATGKSQFAGELIKKLNLFRGDKELNIRYINSERLAGFEEKEVGWVTQKSLKKGLPKDQLSNIDVSLSSAGYTTNVYSIIHNKYHVQLKIEEALSKYFNKEIYFPTSTDYIIPKIRDTEKGNGYMIKEKECHGLKELITLLAIIYDDSYNCYIIDEPELHLHPQYQSFLLTEMKKYAGDPFTEQDKKCFFIITHSPYFIDINNLEELKYCFFFHYDKLPSNVNLDEMNSYVKGRLKCLLPRLNSHHKQFFFSPRPIFVEGYSDQQVFNSIIKKININIGASGSCFIGVDGKDDFYVYYNFCNEIKLDPKFIIDIDFIIKGRLKQEISKSEKCSRLLADKGIEKDFMNATGKILSEITKCVDSVVNELSSSSNIKELKQFKEALENEEDIDKKRRIFLVGLANFEKQIKESIQDEEIRSSVDLICGRLNEIIQILTHCGIYVLYKGQLENYFITYNENPFIIPKEKKQSILEKELEHITSDETSSDVIKKEYSELIKLLKEATQAVEIDILPRIIYICGDFIHNVQKGFLKKNFTEKEQLQKDEEIDWEKYSGIFEIVSFSTKKGEGKFNCVIKLNQMIDKKQRYFEFDLNTNAIKFDISNLKE